MASQARLQPRPRRGHMAQDAMQNRTIACRRDTAPGEDRMGTVAIIGPTIGDTTSDQMQWWDGEVWRPMLGRRRRFSGRFWDGTGWVAPDGLPRSFLWIVIPLCLIIAAVLAIAVGNKTPKEAV